MDSRHGSPAPPPPSGVARRNLSRRRFVRMSGTAALATAVVGGCDRLSTDPAGSDGRSGRTGGTGHSNEAEAPMLAERVRAGDLPAVQDRLPREPLVIRPTDSVGRYGGIWHSWMPGEAATFTPLLETGYDYLVRWDPDWNGVVPNLADWEIHQGGREYTFHLRDGVKWSDGQPFTSDDIAFAYEDIVNNTDLYPAPPSQFVTAKTVATLDTIDQHTVRFRFDRPNGLFLNHLCTPPGGGYLLVPRHYVKKYHKAYNLDADGLADEQGYSGWIDLLFAKLDKWNNPDVPVLNAWQIKTPLAGGHRAVYERNPYYWKTDPEGSQLPYLDRVIYQLIDSTETAILKTASGEIDFNHPRGNPILLTHENKPVLARGRKQGGYDFVDGTSASMNQMIIAFNLAHEDPKLREVFANRNFRVGLSYAIDREQIIDAVFLQQGVPWQAAPREESEFYSETLAKQYTEYDPAKANEHLDAAGFTSRDDDGIRLRPDGEPISFRIDVSTDKPYHISALELVKKTWAEVGIQMQVKTMDRSLFYERKAGNLQDATVWGGGGGNGDVILNPRWYFPYSDGSNYAIPWATWYNSGGNEGQEPPTPAREQMKLYDRVTTTTDKQQRHDLFMQLLGIAQEQFWAIGTVLPVGTYGTVKKSFHNTPKMVRAAWMFGGIGPTRPEQYWSQA